MTEDYDEDDEEVEGSEVHQLWEKLNDDFLLFDRIPPADRLCGSPDVCAFLYLDRKFPDEKNRDMVSAAEHDCIWLRITDEQIATLTEDDVLYLSRS